MNVHRSLPSPSCLRCLPCLSLDVCSIIWATALQELRQAQETTTQRIRFHRAVMEALNARADGLPVPSRPREMMPVPGRPDLFRYQAHSCTPLWFRRPPGSSEDSHDWQWSPDLCVWIDLETMRVPAGIWEGQKPARSNQACHAHQRRPMAS